MSNVIKFQSPFERLKSYNSSPEINLRKAIIMQAVIDATNTSDAPEAKKLELEAKQWLFYDDYFKELCLEAGMDPSFIIKIAKELIRLHSMNGRKISSKKSNNKKVIKKKSLGQMKLETKVSAIVL